MRTLTLVLVSAALLSAPRGLAAQGVRSLSVSVGKLDTRQVGSRGEESRPRKAWTGGVHGEIGTPRRWLGVEVGLALSPRGGAYALPVPSGSGPLYAPVHADYLTFSVLPRVRMGLGPIGVHVFAGPALDIYLRGDAASDVAAGFQDPAPQVVVATAGIGLEVDGPGSLVLGVDARLGESLGGAYRGLPERLRHKSRAVSLRVGFRPTL